MGKVFGARGLLLACTSLASAAIAPTQASAQAAAAPAAQPGPANDSAKLEEIVVTAQKRAQSLQDVPIAVTALTNAALVNNRVYSVTDIKGLVPGLSVVPAAGGSQIPSFSIRGITSYGVVPGSDKEVSIYLDGVYISSPRGSIFNMPDAKSMEVLRGPQGTLFGRNATAGAVVVLADLDADGLSVTAASVEAVGGAAITHVTEVARRSDVESLADLAYHQGGRLDAWINAAGILRTFAILDADESEIDQLFATNLKGQYWGCAAAGRVMRARGGGSIVNISSAAADNPREMLSAYAISKAGVNMLTRSAAGEFGAFHCRVNAIAPGFIETPMVEPAYRDSTGQIDPLLREAFLQARADAVPLGITGRPRDVALAALYLSSDASRFVTGQVLRLNGGLVMA